jgi:hypothetical protein
MANMVRDYIGRCERMQREPDADLLGPLMAALEAWRTDQSQGPH